MKRSETKEGWEGRKGGGEMVRRRLQVLIVLTSEEVRSRLDFSSGPTPLASIFLQLHLPFPCKDSDWIRRREKSRASRETLQKFDISGTSDLAIYNYSVFRSSASKLLSLPLSLSLAFACKHFSHVLVYLFVVRPVVKFLERENM